MTLIILLILVIVVLTCFNAYMCYYILKDNKPKEKEEEPERLIDNMYDVSAFRERMNKLRFSDGEMVNGVKLYSVSDSNPSSYKDSGVEVITEELEVALERKKGISMNIRIGSTKYKVNLCKDIAGEYEEGVNQLRMGGMCTFDSVLIF